MEGGARSLIARCFPEGERAQRFFGMEDADGDVELVYTLCTCRRLRFRFPALDFLRGLDRLHVTANLPRDGERLSCFLRLVCFDGPRCEFALVNARTRPFEAAE